MAVTRTDLSNMMRAAQQGGGPEAGTAMAQVARELGANNLAAKRLREQLGLQRQGMALRERLAALKEQEFNETLPLKKQQLQAEIDKTRGYLEHLDKTLGMREKELGMKERELDYNLDSEKRAFTQGLFGLGYGTPEEREAYLTQKTGGAFSTGPEGQNLGTSFLGGAGAAGGGTYPTGGYSSPMASIPLGGSRTTPGAMSQLYKFPRTSGKVNTSQSLSSSGNRGVGSANVGNPFVKRR